MENAKYKFHYVNGQTEELDSRHKYNEEARADLRVKLTHNPTWMLAGGKHVNLANVISIEVVGENEQLELKLNLKVEE